MDTLPADSEGRPAVAAQGTPSAPATDAEPAPESLASFVGPVGLFHTSTASVGPLHQLRLGLHGEFFGASDFLVRGDTDRRLQGAFVFGYTLHPSVELFGALLNSSNRNTRDRTAADRDPELIKSFGDLVIGAKGVHTLSPGVTMGVELGLKFLSGVSNLAISPSSTSWWLGPLLTVDLRRLPSAVPLRLHTAVSFFGDNSSNLHPLSGVTLQTKEAAMFGYGIAPSRLRLVLAADALLERLLPQSPVDILFEYHLEYVTATADKDFADYMKPTCGLPGAPACSDNRDIHWLTLGARVAVYRGITADVGVDVRLRSPGFPYGPPVPPYNVLFGVSFPLDLDQLTRTVVVTKTVEGPHVAREGSLAGTVRSSAGGAPVPDAIVAVTNRPRHRAATDADGGFMTADLPPGPVELDVTAPNFEPAKVKAVVVAGKPAELAVVLTAKPATANVRGKVSGPDGKGLSASVKFIGAENLEAKADADGAYTASLPVGAYLARAEAAGYAPREAQLRLLDGQDQSLDFALRSTTLNPDVTLAGESIRLKKPLRFVGATAKLAGPSQKLLDGVADLLDVHAEIKRLHVVAHWDNGVGKARAEALTRSQAEAIKSYLVGRGVAEGRVDAVGAGATKPLVPNLGPMNRMRNRRVELNLE